MNSRTLLLLCTALILLIWQLPYGHQLLYPLTLLATFAHEMGHGLAALLVGAEFDQLLLHADGSGLAQWHGSPGRIDLALVAASGLIGPTVAGTGVLLLASSARFARIVLAALTALVLVAVALWVRNSFGVVFLLALAGTMGLAAKTLPDGTATFLLHLMAVTLCLSWWRDLNYMFSAQALVNGVAHPSDTALMAQALWLPYWFWGAAVALVSLVLTTFGIWFVTRRMS